MMINTLFHTILGFCWLNGMADILQVKVIFMWVIFLDMVLRIYIVLAQMQKQDFM